MVENTKQSALSLIILSDSYPEKKKAHKEQPSDSDYADEPNYDFDSQTEY